MSIHDSDDKQTLVPRRLRSAENPGAGAVIPGEGNGQAMAHIIHFVLKVEDLEASVLALKATGCEILGLGGELPVKFRGVSGVVAELVPVGHYKTP